MLDVVRILVGGFGVAGMLYLGRTLPSLLGARRAHAARVGEAARYEAWRGGAGHGPDLLDRLEGELIDARLRRLAGVALAAIVGLLIAIFAPSA